MGREMEGGWKGREYMYTFGWFMLRFDRKQQNPVEQLSFNKKIKKKLSCEDANIVTKYGQSIWSDDLFMIFVAPFLLFPNEYITLLAKVAWIWRPIYSYCSQRNFFPFSSSFFNRRSLMYISSNVRRNRCWNHDKKYFKVYNNYHLIYLLCTSTLWFIY